MQRPPETFGTARLAARPVRAEDAPGILRAYPSDPEVTRYLSWKPYERVEPLADYLRERSADWERNQGHFAWVLSLKGTSTPIGSIGLEPAGAKVMFGYVLARPFWGRGMMVEALTHLVDWSLSQPEVTRAWAYCDIDNPASVRVMEKSGMTREGILQRWHVCPTLGPESRDCVVCAKVR